MSGHSHLRSDISNFTHSHLRSDISDFAHSHVEDTGWIDIQLINGWLNYDSGLSIGGAGRTARYRRLNGIVYHEGVIRSGAGDAFEVPEGFRKAVTTAYEGAWATQISGGTGFILFNATTGRMLPQGAGAATYTYLTGIAPYPADA